MATDPMDLWTASREPPEALRPVLRPRVVVSPWNPPRKENAVITLASVSPRHAKSLLSVVCGVQLLTVVVLVTAAPALAQSAIPAQRSDLRYGKWLRERGPQDPRPHERGDLLIGHGLLRPGYFEFKNRLWVEHGLGFGGYYSVNEQVGTANGSWHGSGEALALAQWELLRGDDRVGRLVFGLAFDHAIGRTTRQFADTQDLVEDPDDLDTGDANTFTTLGLLAWEQEFHLGPDRGWGFRAGQLFAASYFGIVRYLDDDRRNFLARPLAAAAGAQWVGENDIGLGVNVVGWRQPFYASVAVMDAKARRTWPDFDSPQDGELLYVGEVGYERDEGGPNHAALRVAFSHIDLEDGANPQKGPGYALVVSGLRRFDGRFALFGRWTQSWNRESAKYQELLSAGTAWTRPFGRSQDFLGFGVWIGDPSDPDRHTEYGLELSYRIQLTQGLSLLADLQYWLREKEGDDVRAWIPGVRVNFDY